MDGSELPNERTVRTTVLTNKIIKDKKASYLMVMFGQYLSHDALLTSQAETPAIVYDCCDDFKWQNKSNPNCTSVRVSEDDAFYSRIGVTCIPKVRAMTTDDMGCLLEPRQQVNPVSHVIDQSPIYGKTKEEAKKFRGEKGQLQTSKIYNKVFPKNSSDPQDRCELEPGDKEICFDAGDDRVNQNPPLTAMVTIFLRCHNDLAEKLLKLNPKMSHDQVFEEIRRILIAVERFITTEEFLPLLIGREFMAQAKILYNNVDHDDIYDQNLNPSSLNEFAIAYRSLHNALLDELVLHHVEGNYSQSCIINDYFKRPQFAVENFGPLLKSAFKSPMGKVNKHGVFTMDNLFAHLANEHGDDLNTISIMRDREQGLPGFCDYMEQLLNEPKITCWKDLGRYFTQQTIYDLKKVYKHFRDIDMYVGGIAECRVGNSMFGKLFTAIITDQFKRWLVGDRHSPTLRNGPGVFRKRQLQEINKINMAYLLCKYGDNIDFVPSRPFEIFKEQKDGNSKSKVNESTKLTCDDEQADEERPYEVDCKHLPDIDLTPWKLPAY